MWHIAMGHANKLRGCHMRGLLCGLVTVTRAMTSNQYRRRSAAYIWGGTAGSPVGT